MSRRRATRVVPSLTLLGVLAVFGLCASAALAYWTVIGAGSASGPVSAVSPLALSAGIPSSQLYPGVSADVALTVSNPNTTTVHISSLVLETSQGDNGFGVDAAHSGCELSALSFTTATNGGAGWTVPAKVGSVEGSLSIDLSGAVSMATSAAGACQGANFSIFLKASS
jgi:hypothetical protein